MRELRGGRRRVAGWIPLPTFLFGVRRPLDYERNISELGESVAPAPPVVSPGRLAELKLHLQSLVQRLSGSDVATSVHVACASGGGRGLGVAAVIGICLSSVTAGTYCVATLLPDERPAPVVRKAEKRKPEPTKPTTKPQPPVKPEARLATAPAAGPTPAPAPRRRKRRAVRPTAAPSSKPADRQHEAPPPPSPVVQGQQELSFEQSPPATGAPSSSGSAQPAAAPATGGEEFSP